MLNIYKPIGITPLQLIKKLKDSDPYLSKSKIAFAGRLDPLASGVMLFMIDKETKSRNKYLQYDKEYEFEVLFGISTDTYDALGILGKKNINSVPENLEEKLNIFTKSKLGQHVQKYPPYSSKEVSGKPLYQWARENKIAEIEIPSKLINIYKFELLDITKKFNIEIENLILNNINCVSGDFRQSKILEKWKKFFDNNKHEHFTIAKFRINCSSGTYVRSLVHEMGTSLGCSAIALSILRTKVGFYKLDESLKL